MPGRSKRQSGKTTGKKTTRRGQSAKRRPRKSQRRARHKQTRRTLPRHRHKHRHRQSRSSHMTGGESKSKLEAAQNTIKAGLVTTQDKDLEGIGPTIRYALVLLRIKISMR